MARTIATRRIVRRTVGRPVIGLRRFSRIVDASIPIATLGAKRSPLHLPKRTAERLPCLKTKPDRTIRFWISLGAHFAPLGFFRALIVPSSAQRSGEDGPPSGAGSLQRSAELIGRIAPAWPAIKLDSATNGQRSAELGIVCRPAVCKPAKTVRRARRFDSALAARFSRVRCRPDRSAHRTAQAGPQRRPIVPSSATPAGSIRNPGKRRFYHAPRASVHAYHHGAARGPNSLPMR